MREAIIEKPFSIVEWHGEDYPYYEDDSTANAFNVGDKVLILHEAKPNPMGKLFVVFNERTNESAVVSESYFNFINA